MLAPFENPTATGAAYSVGVRAASTEVRKLVRALPHVVLVEHAFRVAAEEARHAVLQHFSARRQQRRAGRDQLAERQQIVLVAAGAVQQQQRRRVEPGAPARSDG